MAEYPNSSSQGAKGGQVPVSGGKSYNINSSTPGGQVPVRSTTEGVRSPDGWTGRGCVSPLGNTTNTDRGNQSPVQERRERP